jgi:uncharacterized protein (TIRG00374 family)
MIRHTKKLLVQSLKLALAAGIIFWLIQSGKLNFTALKNLLSPGFAALGFVLITLNLFLGSERWRALISSQGIKAGPWEVFKLSLIGIFFNFAMPGGVGGDVIKAYYFYHDNPGNKIVAVTSVLMDRVLGLFAMIFLALVVMIYDFQHILTVGVLHTLFWIILALFIGFVVALGLIFSPGLYKSGVLKKGIESLPLAEKFQKLYESMHLYGANKSRLSVVLGLSILSQTCAILFLYLAASAAGYNEAPLKTFFLVAPLGFMATAVPISPAGIGVGQAAFYFLFNLYIGRETELGPTAITAYQVGSFIVSLTGAFFYLRRKSHAPIKAELP